MNESTFLGRMHHIGYVVEDIAASIDGFRHGLAASWDGVVFEDPIQNVKVTFLSTGSGPLIELIQPALPDSPVDRFLREKGPGLHHLCYETSDLPATLKELRSRGAWLVSPPVPAVAFAGRPIAWVLTRERLLIELLRT